LETNPAKPKLLVTEPGVGYRLVVQDWAFRFYPGSELFLTVR